MEQTEPKSMRFDEIYDEEWKEIRQRRAKQFYDKSSLSGDAGSPKSLVGLALSGGGIRSATFCLGLLQGLHKLKMLRIFDYLSTVSGGGYVGGWWSAWLARNDIYPRTSDKDLCPIFKERDIKNVSSLAIKLSEGTDPTSRYLREHFDESTRAELAKYKDGDSPSPKLRQTLLDKLKKVQEGKPRLELAPPDYLKIFSKVKLEEEAKKAEAVRKILGSIYKDKDQLLWLNRMLLEEAYPFELKDIFPPREAIEPDRAKEGFSIDGHKGSDSSLCAGQDPIHHLRLFANYLTPRKGMLSADTWRAVSTIMRNLALTWLILLPILIAVLLLGQFYFLEHPQTWDNFLVPHPPNYLPFMGLLSPPLGSWARSGKIFKAILNPTIVGFLGLLVMMAITWLLCNRETSSMTDRIIQSVCLIAVIALVLTGVNVSMNGTLWEKLQSKEVLISMAILFLIWLCLMLGTFKWKRGPTNDPEVSGQWYREVRRNAISRWQTRLLVSLVVVTTILLIAGLSPIILGPHSALPGKSNTQDTSSNSRWLVGLLPVISAIAGSIFTAMKATPTGGGDKRESREPAFISRIIFAITPILVIAVLAVGIAWLGHGLLSYFYNPLNPGYSMPARNLLLVSAALLGILLCFVIAMNEVDWEIKLSLALILPGIWVAFLVCWIFFTLPSSLIEVGTGQTLEPSGGYSKTTSILFLLAISFIVAASLVALINIVARVKFKKYLDFKHLLLVFLVALVAIWAVFKTPYFTIERVKDLARNPSALLLVMAGLAMSLIVFRLGVMRSKGDTPFKLRWFSKSSQSKETNRLSLYASFCLAIPVAIVCWSHAIDKLLHACPISTSVVDLIALGVFPLIIFPLPEVFISLYKWASAVKTKQGHEPLKENAQPQRPTRIYAGLEKIIPYGRRFAWLLAMIGFGIVLTLGFATKSLAGSSETANAQNMFPFSAWRAFPDWMAIAMAVIAGSVALKVMLTRRSLLAIPDVAPLPVAGGVERSSSKYRLNLNFIVTCAALTVSVGYLASVVSRHLTEFQIVSHPLATAALPGMVVCLTLVVFEMYWGKGENRHTLWLIAAAYGCLFMLFMVGVIENQFMETVQPVKIVLGLLAVALVWIVALGWTIDPNSVSMHQFYKARLVRAYLGASNMRRRKQGKEITESAPGDDLPLSQVRNCQRGGPYHLINTTLNLVAGRDLATAQRSASNFVLSSNYCGSSRTKYRLTSEYMSGRLTLGTAVAASGAAVSPSMGSKKPTAALAMLLTLLNVRLGYWAPTPNRDNWNSSQPKLWPFYLLREFLSQTNDVSSYCYLTDGGHFDNTGLYPLVERGCRFIVLVDCAADPQPPCFQDLGDAIRRCRIDFGTEIKLDLNPFIKDVGKDANRQFSVGGIRYSRKHAEMLGWYPEQHEKGLNGGAKIPDEYSPEDKEYRTGIIIYFKPSIVGKETADVRQYAIENKNFPQQSTANQWFDEAQFESYRRLGQFCAKQAFEGLEHVRRIHSKSRLSPQDIEGVFKEIQDKEVTSETDYSVAQSTQEWKQPPESSPLPSCDRKR
ncbi:MAG: hypothetical protein QOJ02_1838 [Acidobacteriota bacterium]|jgi:predicted acylesterase/phospholipase RssA|nr:hypothetical protein [Acidobacteriota bacterium]